ncbi:unnamed protein product, partial [Ascophyllum nodosum]
MLYSNKLGVESRSLQDATIGELVLLDVKAKDLWKKRHPTWTDRDISDDMRTNYTNKVLKYVPRTVPPAPILVERSDLLIEAFKNVRDAKTGSKITNRLKKAIANLRVHLHNGCLSDPDP